MSNTPISDSTPHNVGDLGMLCRTLERELNASNQIIRQQQLLYETNLRIKNSNIQLREGAEEQKQRIHQLEDRIRRASIAFFEDGSDASVASCMLAILEEERNKP